MDEAERRGVKFPRKGAIVRPQKKSDRVARQRHAEEEARRQRALDGTNADELTAGEIEGRRSR